MCPSCCCRLCCCCCCCSGVLNETLCSSRHSSVRKDGRLQSRPELLRALKQDLLVEELQRRTAGGPVGLPCCSSGCLPCCSSSCKLRATCSSQQRRQTQQKTAAGLWGPRGRRSGHCVLQQQRAVQIARSRLAKNAKRKRKAAGKRRPRGPNPFVVGAKMQMKFLNRKRKPEEGEEVDQWRLWAGPFKFHCLRAANSASYSPSFPNLRKPEHFKS